MSHLNSFDTRALSEFDNHRAILNLFDASSGLHGYIAIHRGGIDRPSFGATRFANYATMHDAIRDALRLSRLMSYKSVMAGYAFGGAKGVIIANTVKKKVAVLRAYAERVTLLHGGFVTGTDGGLTVSDLRTMRARTPHVVGITANPERFTALGIAEGIRAAVAFAFHEHNLKRRSVLIQGLGKVGYELLRILSGACARIVVSDVNVRTVRAMTKQFPRVTVIHHTQAPKERVDVYAPCMLGHAVTWANVEKFRCAIIAGGANNQLEHPDLGTRLFDAGILYAPDYVINAGGLMSVVDEYEHRRFSAERVRRHVATIPHTLTKIFSVSARKRIAPNIVADTMAEKRIARLR